DSQEPDPHRARSVARLTEVGRVGGVGGAVGRDLTPAELDELLAAYALDAVDGDECAQVEAWIARTPRARRDVDELRETASLLSFPSDVLVPKALCSRLPPPLPHPPPPLPLPPLPS